MNDNPIENPIENETLETTATAAVTHDAKPNDTALDRNAPVEPTLNTSCDSQAESTSVDIGRVAYIPDPFQLRTPEISEAQDESDELDLDDSLDDSLDEMIDETIDDDAGESIEDSLKKSAGEVEIDSAALQLETEDTLLRVARAIEAVDTEILTEIEELSLGSAEELTLRLAAEIAEDVALTEAMNQEIQEIKEAEELRQAQEALDRENADEGIELDPELLAALPKAPTDDSVEFDLSELQSCIEALLFMSDKPVSIERLQELLGPTISHQHFLEAATQLRDRYQSYHHGIELIEVAGGLQFRTKTLRAPLARKLARTLIQRLSSGAMETLAIIAYKQPALKDDIDQVRGVDSSHFVRTLLDRKLIQISGRSDLPGRPMVYTTTPDFLELFGLKDLQALPSLRELEQMIPGSETSAEREDPRVKEMRKLVSEMKSDTSVSLIYDPKEDEKILKEIKDKVSLIATSTPYLEEQKLLEKQAAEAAKKTVEELVAESANSLGQIPLSATAIIAEAEAEATLNANSGTFRGSEAPSTDDVSPE